MRRKKAEAPVEEAAPPAPLDPTSGPFDSSAVEGDQVARVDLGSLLVPAMEGRELRLQVDEASGAVRAVILAGADGALEFQAFAAPRNGDLWSDVRPQIADDVKGRGGKVVEREGRWGTELVCALPATLPDGSTGASASRVIGVNGDRWMLRATMMGRPAAEPDSSSEWEDTLAQLVVRRGAQAMAVGEALPVKLPDEARRTS